MTVVARTDVEFEELRGWWEIDLAWSPNGRMLAVWDCNLHYNVLVYSMDGRRLEHYSACAPQPPTTAASSSRRLGRS